MSQSIIKETALVARSLRHRTWLEYLADKLTYFCSTPLFLFLNALFFFGWIYINMYPPVGFVAFDPYPFGFLTMAVSLEAIILSIFVLIAQNRENYVDTIRGEVHLRLNLIAEKEITKSLEILVHIAKKLNVSLENDEKLRVMLEEIDEDNMEDTIAKQIKSADKPLLKRIRGLEKMHFPARH